MSTLKFDHSRISDQKRLVRAEQYLCARTALRIRDHIHHAKWRVLIMAGGSPEGEIRTIQELMPKAHITAVDRDPKCLEAAINAGADDVVQCDLADFTGPIGNRAIGPAAPIRELGRFDIVCLDLCGGVNPKSKDIVRAYHYTVDIGGVLIFTFSYGRDVIEAIGATPPTQGLVEAGVSKLVAQRVGYLFGWDKKPSSLMIYRGAEMPMCSVLFGGRCDFSFVQVERGDFELAVCYPDAANLYDCPQERIESLRRKFAAIRASITRTQRRPQKVVRAATAPPLLVEAEKTSGPRSC